MDSAQQVGTSPVYIDGAGDFDRACLWTGSSASAEDLPCTPSRAVSSAAAATDAGLQVGYAVGPHRRHYSCQPLEQRGRIVVRPWLAHSHLRLFWRGPHWPTASGTTGATTYIVGIATDNTTGQTQAVMWVGEGCNPALWFTSQPSTLAMPTGGTASCLSSARASLPDSCCLASRRR